MSEDYNIHIIKALENITKRIENSAPKGFSIDVSDITTEIEKAKKELYNNCSDGR